MEYLNGDLAEQSETYHGDIHADLGTPQTHCVKGYCAKSGKGSMLKLDAVRHSHAKVTRHGHEFGM